MAALDVATALENVRDFYAAMTSWRAICGVSTSAEAEERIYIGGTEEDVESLVPSIVLEVFALPIENTGGHYRSPNLEVLVWCEIAVPVESCRTLEDQYLYVWQRWSLMAAELDVLSRSDGGGMSRDMRFNQLPGRKDSKLNQGRKEWGFAFIYTTHLI